MRYSAIIGLLCNFGLLCGSVVHAQSIPSSRPKILARLTTTGSYFIEHEQLNAESAMLASPAQLAFGDLRLVLATQRWPHRRLEFSLDARARATGNFENQDYEAKFNSLQSQQIITARGYLGGPEFEIRQLSVGISITDPDGPRPLSLSLGRIFINEADVLKIDGARLHLSFGRNRSFGLGAFVGAAPNPYSRSVLTDYAPPCGAGVAAGSMASDQKNVAGQSVVVGPCVSPGNILSLGTGLTANYRANGDWGNIWGTLALASTIPSGNNDGGPVVADPGLLPVGNLVDSRPGLDTPRVYVAWMNHVMPLPRWDLLSNLVLDFPSSHGTQLTRALLVSNFRFFSDSRLQARIAYSYMSSLAVDMFLASLLYNRFPNGTTLTGNGIVENNLTVQRTGRHEGRATIDLRLVSMLRMFLEGRVRHRALLDGDRNSSVFENDALYGEQQRSLAGELSVGLRDEGSLAGIRAGLSYLFLEDFRARSHVVRASVGRTLWRPASRPSEDGFAFELDGAVLRVQDAGVGQSGCGTNIDPGAGAQNIKRDPITGLDVYRLDSTRSLFALDCFGRRTGTTIETGLSTSIQPHRFLFIYADYRFNALLTDPQPAIENPSILVEQGSVFGHAFLLRLDWRYERQLCTADEKRSGQC